MATTGPTDALTAFELLLGEIQAQVNAVKQSVATATGSDDYTGARVLLDRIEKMIALKARVDSLRQEWSALAATPRRSVPPQGDMGKRHRIDHGRLQPGLATPVESYYLPILRVLKAAGGKARTSDVLVEVEKSMRSILRQVDREPRRGNPRDKRWSNRAEWARQQMVDSGLMVKGSPRGIWEISQAGLDYVTNNSG